MLQCSPIFLVGTTYDGLSTPSEGAFPAPGALPGVQPPFLDLPGVSPYAEAMRRCAMLFSGYRYLGREAERCGLAIRTVGNTSFLDLFPRVSAEQAFTSAAA